MSDQEKSPEFDKYVQLHSKSMELLVDFYNQSVSFSRWRGRETARQLRNTLRELINTEKELYKSIWKSHREFLVISKSRRKYSERTKLKYQRKKIKDDTNN
jgi:hypothetical protein